MSKKSYEIQGKPIVSIVIVNFNGKQDTINCLNSLLPNLQGCVEIIVVDNGSTDNSWPELIRRFGADPRFKLIQSERNLGFGAANNIGVEKSSGKYLIFLNNDTVVNDPFFAKKIESVFESDTSVGIIQPKIIVLGSNPPRHDYAGGYIDKFGFTYRRGESEIDVGQYDQATEVFYAKGAALAIRRELFDKVGGFDSDYFIYYDDIDLCWRVKLAGYHVLYAPVTTVYHTKSKAVSKLKRTPTYKPRLYYNYRNHLTTLLKNQPSKHLILKIPVLVLFLFLGNLFISLVKMDLGYLFSYVRVIFYNIKKSREIYRNRIYVRNIIQCYPKLSVERTNLRKLKTRLITTY